MKVLIAVLGAIAASVALYGAGYYHGNRNIDQAASTAGAVLALLQKEEVAEKLGDEGRESLDDLAQAISEKDFERADGLLPSLVAAIEQPTCFPSTEVFLVVPGALAINCETGMSAAIAALISNKTLTLSIGSKPASGSPGSVFTDDLKRYPDCRLRYHTMEAQDDGKNAARMSFDCKKADG